SFDGQDGGLARLTTSDTMWPPGVHLLIDAALFGSATFNSPGASPALGASTMAASGNRRGVKRTPTPPATRFKPSRANPTGSRAPGCASGRTRAVRNGAGAAVAFAP